MGVGPFQDRQVIGGKDRRTWHIDYPLPSASAAVSNELFAQDKPLPEIFKQVARLGAQLLMQAALEAEITDFLGRDRYRRAAACDEARPISRNGYRERR